MSCTSEPTTLVRRPSDTDRQDTLVDEAEAAPIARHRAVERMARARPARSRSGWRGEADQLEIVFDDHRAVGQHPGRPTK